MKQNRGKIETLLPSDKMHLPVRHGCYLHEASSDEGAGSEKFT